MKTVRRLLASKSKADVHDSMELFRISYEYKFDAAEAGIKKVLHLSWAKETTTQRARMVGR